MSLQSQAQALLPNFANLAQATPIEPAEFDFDLHEADKRAIQVHTTPDVSSLFCSVDT
jgi:hypothetical protein